MWEHSCGTTTGTAAELFLSTISFLFTTQCYIPPWITPYNNVTDLSTYHYIIVGGGSSGAVLANRLSEVTGWNVLLLEAGPEPPIESDIPQMDSSLYRTDYDWKYTTQVDGKKDAVLKNSTVPWPRGKMLGGCSSINAMFYVRGRDPDFQAWANDGNTAWTPKNVTAAYLKNENFQNANLNQNSTIYNAYGHTGPLVINSFNSTTRDITLNIVDSFDSIGIKKVPELNVANYTGRGLSGILSVTAANGQRQSTYRAFLQPASSRSNLKIVTNAFVTKVLINNTKAYGVEVDIYGVRKTLFASLEVILSAGSINTPQLLMLSGIGNKTHLTSKNITCLVDLPGVGQNLQDHPYVLYPIYADQLRPENKDEKSFDVLRYLYNKTGYLAEGTISDFAAFYSHNTSLDYPELQTLLKLFPVNSTQAIKFFSGFRDDARDSFTQYISNKTLYMFSIVLLHQYSRGYIYLNSSNPYDKPLIYANYLNDTRDIETLVNGAKILTELLSTTYFKSINAFVQKVNISECSAYEYFSDAYWGCYALLTVRTLFHPVGTAKMGSNSTTAVVNNTLQVYGTSQLRVCDASIMPTLTSGNTNAPSIMIGQMCADMIKAAHST